MFPTVLKELISLSPTFKGPRCLVRHREIFVTEESEIERFYYIRCLSLVYYLHLACLSFASAFSTLWWVSELEGREGGKKASKDGYSTDVGSNE